MNKVNESLLQVTDTEYGNGRDSSLDIKMLQKNDIPKLVNIKRIVEDDDVTYRYDISDLISFQDLVKADKLDTRRLRDFIRSIEELKDNISEYFLDDQSILLSPEYIYYSKTSQKYIFIYIPGENIFKESISKLSEYLLSNVDYSDKIATKIVYEIYSEINCGRYEFSKYLKNIFENIEEETSSEDTYKDETETIERENEEDIFLTEKNTNGLLIFLSSIVVVIITIGGVCFIKWNIQDEFLKNRKMISFIAILCSICVLSVFFLISEIGKSSRRRRRIRLLKELSDR